MESSAHRIATVRTTSASKQRRSGMTDIQRSVRANLFANVAGQAWAASMTLAFTPVYLHHVGAEGYGLIGFFAIIQACLSLLDLSIGQTLSREIAQATASTERDRTGRALLRSCEWVCALGAVAFAVAVWSASDWLADHWIGLQAISHGEAAQAIAFMGVAVGVRALEGLYRGVLIGSQRHDVLNAATAFVATIRWGGAAAALTWLDAGIAGFFLWQVLSSFVAVALLAVLSYGLLKPAACPVAPTWRALAPVCRFSRNLLLTGVLAIALTQADKLVLSHHLRLEDFGHYSIAVLASNALYYLVGPVTQTFSPRLAALAAQDQQARLHDTYHLGAQVLSALLFPTALSMVVFAEPLLRAWTQDAHTAAVAAPILSVLAAGTLLNGLMGMPHMLQLAHGWAALAMRINATAACLYIPAVLVLAPRYGMPAAALLWLVLHALTLILGAYSMHQRILVGHLLHWYGKDLLCPALAAGAVVLCSALLHPTGLTRLAEGAWFILTNVCAMGASALACQSIRQRMRTLVR